MIEILAAWWSPLVAAVASRTVLLAIFLTVRHVSDARASERKSDSDATVVEEREETARMRIRDKAREREDRVIEAQLQRCHDERQRISDERNVLVQNVTALVEENAQLRSERINVEERIDAAERDLRAVREELRGCHDQHAQTAQQLAETVAWVRENFVPRGHVADAPRARIVTPADMPAVTKERT